jgi:hypothetical protein
VFRGDPFLALESAPAVGATAIGAGTFTGPVEFRRKERVELNVWGTYPSEHVFDLATLRYRYPRGHFITAGRGRTIGDDPAG